MTDAATSTPSFLEFNPDHIPYQRQVITDVRQNFDYSKGTHEVLLSGSVGSAKSTLMAHIVLTHVLFNPGSRFMLGRLSMPALRSTLFNKVLEHIGPDLIEIKDYKVNQTSASIKFWNNSEIISRSWQDAKYFKVRSLELSGAAIEETAENPTPTAYDEIKMRVGRLPHVKENIILNATNPDEPHHWLYKRFILPNSSGNKHQTRHVYYSRTEENPFLPPQYIEQLKRDLDPLMARRMLYGEWLSIAGDNVYYAYNRDLHFTSNSYIVNPAYPVWLSWDFNIGHGKPMSACAMQYINGTFHIFSEVIIDGARTADTVDEFIDRGIIKEGNQQYFVTGDASGRARDTRSSVSDYDIIAKKLAAANIKYALRVPLSNPPVRARHNKVNAKLMNSLGESRVIVWNCPTIDEGLRMVKLKKGSNYIEDDSFRAQHVTTAIGYAIMVALIEENRPKPYSIIL